MKKENSKKHGFTLAEILITLTVIGVVAALTIPTLLQNTNQAELKTAWKRSFADVSQASRLIANDQGGALGGTFGSILNDQARNDFKNFFRNKLSYIKDCPASTSTECWHQTNNWFNLSGAKKGGTYWQTKPGLILSNGDLVGFDSFSLGCNATYTPNSDACAEITVDINGFKPPNTIGKDIFSVWVLNNGNIIPFGTQGDRNSNPTGGYYTPCDLSLNPNSSGQNCSADYLYQ